mmetsp:Transcript_26145/g.36636  ORF Transcript_26145/g.36636 Transcript_26145/m.36636 type:complete len:341 (-) Transcript_26145:532-1554(-)
MGMSTGLVFTSLSISGLYFLRRRVTSNWIDLRKERKTNMGGNVVIVTGGNSGLGYQTASDLAHRGATVVLACRDLRKAREAASTIRKSAAKDNTICRVECAELDLASLASVRTFSEEIKSKFNSIDALVCNAGVWVPMETHLQTKDGYEIHFGVNHLGHFYLIQQLLNRLQKSNSRVVIVSSGLMKSGQLNMETTDFLRDGRIQVSNGSKKKREHAPTGYCDSKLANALCCRHLAQVCEGTSIATYCVCPGWCSTDLARNVGMSLATKILLSPFAFMFMRSSQQGAQNIIYSIIEDKKNLQNGGFYRDGKIAEKETDVVNNFGDLSEQLWKLSKDLVRDK